MSQARVIAVELLSQIQDRHQTLDTLLNNADGKIQNLNRADRALVHALVYGVLRWQSRLDWIIDQLAARNKKIDSMVRIILRLGIFQLLYLQRIPPSAAVNTSVDLAKTNNRKWAAGFVNGLLRQAIRRIDHLEWPDASKNPAAFLSVTYAVPQWMIQRWMLRWGKEKAERFCQSINMIPAITIRTNTLKTSRDELKNAITAETLAIQETAFSPEGLRIEHLNRPLPQWPAFQKGWFQIHSESAQLVSHWLDPQPGETVWDVCAGLGTKTGHLAQLMGNQGRILATDLHAEKLQSLTLEMKRLGVDIVETAPMDLTAPARDLPSDAFDRILVDAPCSGLGVLQKNPDGKWRVKPEDILANRQRQISLLENTARHLKLGGVLLYAVCSLEPEENEDVVDGFLLKHPEFGIYRPNVEKIDKGDLLLTPKGFLMTIPHLHLMDGFFAAALRKKCQSQASPF